MSNLTVPALWPDWAVSGVVLEGPTAFDDSGVPLGGHYFFKCAADLIRFIRQKRTLCILTGIVINVTVYKWDWGPQVVFSRQLG